MHVKQQHIDLLEKESSRLRTLLHEGKAQEAISGARKLLAHDPDDFNFCQSSSGLLIDAGSDASDLDAIDEGIAVIQRILDEVPTLPEEHSIRLRYNLSNGHAARYHVFRSRGPSPGQRRTRERERVSPKHNAATRPCAT